MEEPSIVGMIASIIMYIDSEGVRLYTCAYYIIHVQRHCRPASLATKILPTTDSAAIETISCLPGSESGYLSSDRVLLCRRCLCRAFVFVALLSQLP